METPTLYDAISQILFPLYWIVFTALIYIYIIYILYIYIYICIYILETWYSSDFCEEILKSNKSHTNRFVYYFYYYYYYYFIASFITFFKMKLKKIVKFFVKGIYQCNSYDRGCLVYSLILGAFVI